MALRERLPKVAALFTRGQLSAGLVSTITWRTQLIVDSSVAARVDAAIAERAGQWGVLSVARLEAAIDAVVDQYDPDARRRLRQAAQNRDVRVGKRDDVTGTMSLWGRLSTTDGVLLERRLAQMISQVCPDDPRTLGQRRSEALGGHRRGCPRTAVPVRQPAMPLGRTRRCARGALPDQHHRRGRHRGRRTRPSHPSRPSTNPTRVSTIRTRPSTGPSRGKAAGRDRGTAGRH
ncbi:13E12 repeat family protein [Mycolicibacterium novocastrense]|nr:13E12 repeat family protein [Mycolicibacterium novocastrense]